MSGAAWLLPALPFLAALVGLVVPVRSIAAPLAIIPTALTTVLAVALALDVAPDPARIRETAVLLAPTGGVEVTAGTRVDGTAALVAVAVCVVALLVQVYSTAYLAGDERYPTYAAQVSLFTAAMLLVVVAADLLVLLVGWEVMGLCSYLLIGHYRTLPGAAEAAVKAFLVTRVGDVGFLLGVLVLGAEVGSFRIADVLAAAPTLSAPTLTLATLLLLAGVAGKSAQFPLHTWLPDAMAGPTPISALIHAATMVAAGVYVVVRLYPLYARAPVTLDVLGVIAAITMLLGALCALVQDDLKRVLAWSTVSQLGYMTGGLAVGGVTASVFHLLTHAAFKALLFLAAGCVLHTVGTNLMSEMGGLRRGLPLTFAATCVGAAALAGLAPLSGALSKDAVLDAALVAARGDAPVGVRPAVAALVLAAGLATVVLTAAYATRLVVRTFLGQRRGTAAVHEPPPAMTVPLVVLAVPTLLLGLAAAALPQAAPALIEGTGEVHVAAGPLIATTALVLAGAVAVLLASRRAPGGDPAALLGRAGVPLRRAFYLDEVYDALVVRPTRLLAGAVLTVDSRGVDGLVEASGTGARGAALVLSRLQSGTVQSYAAVVLLGALALAVLAGVS